MFERFLTEHPLDDHAAFETLCRDNPSHAERLHAIRADLVRLTLEVPGPLEVGARGSPLAGFDAETWQRLRATGLRGSRYEPRGEVASGGMGVILRVWDAELRRTLAMKVMRQDADGDARLSRFLFEAQLTGQLDHPGIVPVHEIGLCAGLEPYYTMPLIRGHHFGRIIEWSATGTNGWTRLRAIDVLRKVCDTIRFAHDRGVIHRDLKPSNLMVGAYGEVFVMDWGLARVSKEESAANPPRTDRGESGRDDESGAASPFATQDGDVVGTPSYMSPEQAMGRIAEVDRRTDVYSLGAILYHLLVGHPPYSAAGAPTDSDAVLRRLRAGPPQPVPVRRSRCGELGAICNKAMAREPADRYQSVGALAEELQAYADGRVVGAYGGGWVDALRKWVNRNRALTATGILALIVTLLGVLVLTDSLQRNKVELARRSRILLLASLRQFEDHCSTAPPDAAASATAWYFASARDLVAGGTSANAGLTAHEQELARLLAGASGTDPARAPDYNGRPLSGALREKHDELLWRRRVCGVEPWLTHEDVERRLVDLGAPTTFDGKCSIAWQLVDPDRNRRFGDEQCAVRLAESAAQAVTDYDRMRAFDTWAFALARVGSFEEAIDNQRIALRHAQAYARAGVSVDGKPVGEWRMSITDNLRLLERLAYTRAQEEGDRLAALEEEIVRLERLQFEHSFLFRNEVATQEVRELLEVVERLRRIERRLRRATEATETKPAVSAWTRIAEELAADDRFAGTQISPQLDLLPLGRDHTTGLQEFAHLPTGFPPRRDGNGRLMLTANSAVVFVLVPPSDRVPAFFLSKFETTVAQWARMAGCWSIAERDTSSVWAVDEVSWNDVVARLRSAGSWLRLPTDDEWVWAFAAGREPDWLRNASESDLRQTDTLDPWGATEGPGPVDRRLANPWGFYEMVGNVREFGPDRAFSAAAIELPRRTFGWSRLDSLASLAGELCGERDERTGQVGLGFRAARSLMP